jgi:hypothetical protein
VDTVAFPIVEWMEHSWLFAALVSIVFGAFWFVECLFGASWGPLAVVLSLVFLFSADKIEKYIIPYLVLHKHETLCQVLAGCQDHLSYCCFAGTSHFCF